MNLDLETLKAAISGTAAAFRCLTEYQPAGGPGDKIFPPTYEGGNCAEEDRRIDGQDVKCVVLDSVQSQANRQEVALLDAHRARRIQLPLVVVRFDDDALLKRFTVTSLEAPHRIADALFRDSLLDGIIFRQSEKGRVLDTTDLRNATGVFGLNPTALVFGIWDSTGPRGGLGAKFQRALVSEIVGYDAVRGVRTSSRIDPAQVMLAAGPLYARKKKSDDAPAWTLDVKLGDKKLGKDGKPSEAVHGNIPPTIETGGYTISHALQTTVLSLTALRRLRFPLNGAPDSDATTDNAARTALAALALTAATLSREEGMDLRSRCQLFATEAFTWELLAKPGKAPEAFALDGDGAIDLLNEAIQEAKAAGLPWDGEIELTPSGELLELVRRSQQLASAEDERVE